MLARIFLLAFLVSLFLVGCSENEGVVEPQPGKATEPGIAVGGYTFTMGFYNSTEPPSEGRMVLHSETKTLDLAIKARFSPGRTFDLNVYNVPYFLTDPYDMQDHRICFSFWGWSFSTERVSYGADADPVGYSGNFSKQIEQNQWVNGFWSAVMQR